MPYIAQERRDQLDIKIKDVFNEDLTVGELNYLITKMIKNLIDKKKRLNQFSYQFCNDIMGALECAKIEFYNRVVTPYERLKQEQNGDVY